MSIKAEEQLVLTLHTMSSKHLLCVLNHALSLMFPWAIGPMPEELRTNQNNAYHKTIDVINSAWHYFMLVISCTVLGAMSKQ